MARIIVPEMIRKYQIARMVDLDVGAGEPAEAAGAFDRCAGVVATIVFAMPIETAKSTVRAGSFGLCADDVTAIVLEVTKMTNR